MTGLPSQALDVQLDLHRYYQSGPGKEYASAVTEQMFGDPAYGERIVPAGSTVYARLQCSGTADTGLSMAAWAVS